MSAAALSVHCLTTSLALPWSLHLSLAVMEKFISVKHFLFDQYIWTFEHLTGHSPLPFTGGWTPDWYTRWRATVLPSSHKPVQQHWDSHLSLNWGKLWRPPSLSGYMAFIFQSLVQIFFVCMCQSMLFYSMIIFSSKARTLKMLKLVTVILLSAMLVVSMCLLACVKKHQKQSYCYLECIVPYIAYVDMLKKTVLLAFTASCL